MSTRAAIYVRISDDREGREVGVTNQQHACEAEAERRGWRNSRVYKDNDRGASTRSKKARPEYEAMLAAVRAGEIDAVVCYSTSRLTRRPRQLEDWLDLADAGRFEAAFYTGPAADWSNPQGRAMARTLAAWDAAEAETIGDRVAFSRSNKARRGEWAGTDVFGWNAQGQLVTDEADAIRDACTRLLEGEALRPILREWNARGMVGKRGKPWTTTTLRQVLMRPRNAAIVVYRGEELTDVTAQWEPIVTRELHAAVIRLLADPGRRVTKTNVITYMCAGLAKCKRCDSPMRSASAGVTGKRSMQYRCSREGCGNSITMSYLDDSVRAAVLDYLMTAPTRAGAVADRESEAVAGLYAKLDDVLAAREDILSLIKSRALTAAQAARDLAELGDTETAIREDIATAQADNVYGQLMTDARRALYQGGKVSIADAVKVKAEIGERFDALPVHKRRMIARAALPLIVVHPGQRGGHMVAARTRGLARIEIPRDDCEATA